MTEFLFLVERYCIIYCLLYFFFSLIAFNSPCKLTAQVNICILCCATVESALMLTILCEQAVRVKETCCIFGWPLFLLDCCFICPL